MGYESVASKSKSDRKTGNRMNEKHSIYCVLITVLILLSGCSNSLTQDEVTETPLEVKSTYESVISGSAKYGSLSGLGPTTQIVGSESSLSRETVVMNSEDAPFRIVSADVEIKVKDVTRYSIELQYGGIVEIDSKAEIAALEYSISLFDVFGRHMVNLGGSEVQDIPKGENMTFESSWRADDDAPSTLLTSVVFARRVRFVDGTQWEADYTDLVLGLQELELEKLEGKVLGE